MSVIEREPPAPPRKRRRLARYLDDDRRLGRTMLAPAILYIVLLVGFPFLLALYYSVSNATVGARELSFAGFTNFQRALRNPTFLAALKNTFIFTIVSQVVVVVLAKALALAFLTEFRGKRLVRFLVLLPWVAPISLGAIGWLWTLDSTYSVINWTARAIGIIEPGTWPIWLGQPSLAMASVITVHVWRLLPLATVIILAGLTSIPKDLHDAAEMDGAGALRHLFQVTVPLVLPIMLVAVLFGLVFTFTDMIVIYVLTRGGPFDTTQVLASYAYFTGIDGGDLAGGAAIALFLFPVLAAAAILILRLARRAEVA
jgi:multiple sugar transport system permease protein